MPLKIDSSSQFPTYCCPACPLPLPLPSHRPPAATNPMSFLANLRQNSGLQADPAWRKHVVRWSLVSLLLISLAAYSSYGFFQFDEHYQIVEFVSYKLGRTPGVDLPWEFREQLRPWLQPAVYYGVAKALMSVGIHNPFTLAIAFRGISGLIGWTAITALMIAAGSLSGGDQRRRAAVILLALLWLIPYLAVRTSSESLSGDFLTLGVVALVLGSARPARSPSGECFRLLRCCGPGSRSAWPSRYALRLRWQ